MTRERKQNRENFGAKDIYSETGGHVLTPFFGTCQKQDEGARQNRQEDLYTVDEAVGRL